jgi:peptide/nickel transport system substrate-binding protein
VKGRRRVLGVVAVVSVLAIVGAACSNNNNSTGTSPNSSTPKKGGVYRTAIEAFGFTGAFDPTGEYLGTAFGLYSQLLLRNLVTYKHVEGSAGDVIVPDLATNTGTVSSDGLTYTFTLKDGIKWGPPLTRAITSADVAYAFQRINTKALVAQYGFYYDGVIEGMTGTAKSADQTISGIETPDDKTITFHLTQPTGDFLYRLAMPAAAPQPKEVAGCFTKAGDYGRDVIASGPYMIMGSDQVDATSCSTIQPIAGYDPTKFLKFVRNPNYDPSTDSPDVRSNYVNGVDIELDTNTDDIFNKIQSGALDGSLASTPPATIEQQYLTNPDLKGLLHSDPGDRTWYIFMNLLTPPFDNIHVRKAVNYIVDKAAIQKVWGGPIHGDIASHIIPPTVLPGFPADYNPYATSGNAGDLNKAKAEMKQATQYDTNGDGICDASACKNVLFINRSSPPQVDMTPILTTDLAKIGIQLKARELDAGTAYTTVATVNKLIPIGANAGWGKDYADPSTFAVLFQSSGINCSGGINYSNVGMSAAQAKECGVTAEFNAATKAGALPNVDNEVNQCNQASGDARTQCWVKLDQDLMENVVPWVPYLFANALTVVNKDVVNYQFDQFSGILSLCHLAVNNNATMSL